MAAVIHRATGNREAHRTFSISEVAAALGPAVVASQVVGRAQGDRVARVSSATMTIRPVAKIRRVILAPVAMDLIILIPVRDPMVLAIRDRAAAIRPFCRNLARLLYCSG